MAAGDVLQLGATTRLTVVDGDGDRLEVEARYEPAGAPPPHHFHPSQDEHFEVLDGSMQVRVANEEPQEITVGDELVIGRGTPHSMWNEADEPAVLRWVTTPAGRTEEWFRTLDSFHRRTAAGETVEPDEYTDALAEFEDVFRLAL